MKRIRIFTLLLSGLFYMTSQADSIPAQAAPEMTLEQCRALALAHNKGIKQAEVGQTIAHHNRAAARTNYLPKLNLTAGYTHLGRSISLLSDERKAQLSDLGTSLVGALTPELQQMAQGLLATHPELAPLVQRSMAGAPAMAQRLNGLGQQLASAFDTDNHDVALGSLLLTQPLYLGGKIRAYDRLTRHAESLADERLRAEQQEVVLEVDKAYWQVVSLTNKRQLAVAYRELLERLQADVEKMIANGVATRANQLAVSVELNKAEMTLMKVEDGLTLSRMLLAQICGLPLQAPFSLTDEHLDRIPTMGVAAESEVNTAWAQRSELRQLELAQKIYAEKTKIERAAFLPTVALTAGATATYPSLYNGFEKKLAGNWSVGIVLRVPLWTWGENRHKVAAARAEVTLAQLRQAEAREKIELQVNQSAFAVNEALRKLQLTAKNLEKAEENLRMTKVGHAEGMIPTSELLSAQTAWVAAHSDQIDATIDTMLARAAHQKALGQ